MEVNRANDNQVGLGPGRTDGAELGCGGHGGRDAADPIAARIRTRAPIRLCYTLFMTDAALRARRRAKTSAKLVEAREKAAEAKRAERGPRPVRERNRVLPVRLSAAETAAIGAMRLGLGIATDAELIRRALRELAHATGVEFPTIRPMRTPGIRSWCSRCPEEFTEAEKAAQRKPEGEALPVCDYCLGVECAKCAARLTSRQHFIAERAAFGLAKVRCEACRHDANQLTKVKCLGCTLALTVEEDEERLAGGRDPLCRHCARRAM